MDRLYFLDFTHILFNPKKYTCTQDESEFPVPAKGFVTAIPGTDQPFLMTKVGNV